MSLGSTILKYRKEMGITQESLAQQLEVTNQAVSKWESDQCCPDVLLLPRLADLFGITMDALFEREAPQKNQTVEGLPWPDDGSLRGVLFRGWELIGHGVGPKLKLFFKGAVEGDVRSDFSVVCGDVAGKVDAGGNVTCEKNIGGDVNAGGEVSCASIGGNIEAGGEVNCARVEGSIEAGGDVNCATVCGYVEAGGDVTCGDVTNGYVEAGGDVTCGDVINGYVEAGGDVACCAVGGYVEAGGDVNIQK